MAKVVGIDQSLTSTGIAVTEGGELVEVDTFKPRNLKGFERVQAISDMVLARAEGADLVVIESPIIYGGASGRIPIIGLFGVLTQDLWRAGHSPLVVTSSVRCKYATGVGNASKDQVLIAAVRRYQDERITGNDTADAVIFAALGSRLLGEPLEESLPQANLSVFDKIVLPHR